jgi:hypothetical protein
VIALKGSKAITGSLPGDKTTWFSLIIDTLRRLGAEQYFLVCEAWTVEMNQMVTKHA